MFCADGKILFDDFPWDIVETVKQGTKPNQPKFRGWLDSQPKVNRGNAEH